MFPFGRFLRRKSGILLATLYSATVSLFLESRSEFTFDIITFTQQAGVVFNSHKHT